MSQRIPQKPKRRRLDYRQDPCRDVFTCRVCGWPVGPQAAGTQHRNHCPNCLASVHLDDEPGDRAADCGGTMEPVAVWVRKGGEWAIIHRCKRCGKLSSNRVAADDNPMKLMSIAMKPLCAPPFPLDDIEEMTALMGGEWTDAVSRSQKRKGRCAGEGMKKYKDRGECFDGLYQSYQRKHRQGTHLLCHVRQTEPCQKRMAQAAL